MKFNSIQYIRGIAASLVVFYHETVYLSRIRGDSALLDVFGGMPGLYGVVAFFVLSGYLMAEIAPKYRPTTFLLHRVTRIYPAYWACVVLAAVLFAGIWLAVKPNADYLPNIKGMLLGAGFSRDLLRLTLAPVVFADFPLGIEWTLLYETTFYLMVFALSCAGLVNYMPQFAALWLAGIAGAVALAPGSQAAYTSPSLLTLPLFGINAAFILGVIGSRLQASLPPRLTVAAGIALLALVPLFPGRWAMLQVCAGIAACVMGLVAIERKGALGENRALRRLGDWSYAMYLMHVPVVVGTFKLMNPAPPWLMMAVASLLVLVVSAVVGSMDVAGYQRLKAIVDRSGPSARRAAAALFLCVFLGAALIGLRPH